MGGGSDVLTTLDVTENRVTRLIKRKKKQVEE